MLEAELWWNVRFLSFHFSLRETLVTSLPSPDAAVPKTLNNVRWTESQLFQKQSLSL